ncbi:MAG: hypothetical protein J6328_01750 [Bacilli bacterium]|nr:hypothetical protein [Bacilli bacterium]
MKVFSPREGSIQNIAYISIMASIDVVFALLAAFFPFGAIFLMLFLPIPSVIAAYYSQNRYIPIYLLGAIGLSFIATIWDFQATLFYAVPAISSGTLYGFLKKKRFSVGETIFLTGLLNMGLAYLSIFLIKSIYSIDMIAFLLSLIGLQDNSLVSMIVPAAVLTYGLIQETIANIIIQAITEKIPDTQSGSDGIHDLIYALSGVIFGLLGLGLSFVAVEVSYCLLLSLLFFFPFSLYALIKKGRKWIYAPLILLFIAGMSFFYIFYASVPKGYGLLLLGCPLLLMDIFISIYRAILLKNEPASTINVEGAKK